MTTRTITCDFCKKETENYVDGRTSAGYWANLCPKCHKLYGVGLGTGQGQKYGPWAEKASPKKKGPQETFDVWFAKVDQAFGDKYGLSINDIPDRDYQKAYSSGISPQAYVSKLKIKDLL